MSTPDNSQIALKPGHIAQQAATNFALDHFGDWPGDDIAAIRFQQAIDTATAELRQENERLKARIAELTANHQSHCANLYLKIRTTEDATSAKDQRIAALEKRNGELESDPTGDHTPASRKWVSRAEYDELRLRFEALKANCGQVDQSISTQEPPAG